MLTQHQLKYPLLCTGYNSAAWLVRTILPVRYSRALMSKSGLKMVITGIIIYWKGNWIRLCSNTLSPRACYPLSGVMLFYVLFLRKVTPGASQRASVYDNYRGIAVGALMGKLYSMKVEACLDRFCEDHGYRAGH
jgi:hypothetical protein